MKENQTMTDPVSKLSQAIRDVKNASADREDVVVELREASRMRLELLAAELADVIADIPEDNPQFDFAVSSGLQPRLWIDATAHVAMGRDKRAYRFVRDSRVGRVILAESTEMKPVVDQITRYVAERIVERQRMLDGIAEPLPKPATAESAEPARIVAAPQPKEGSWGAFFAGLTLVLLGAVAGAVAILAWLWDKFPATLTP